MGVKRGLSSQTRNLDYKYLKQNSSNNPQTRSSEADENKFRIPHNALLRELQRSLGILRIVKYRRIRRAGYLARTKGTQTLLRRDKPLGKLHFKGPINITMDFTENCYNVDAMAPDRT